MIKVALSLSIIFSFSIKALTVTSLNIQWYGRGGSMYGLPSDEYRDEKIKDFLTKQIPKSDVFVLQELTDTARISALLPNHFCETYGDGGRGHQNVSICVKNNSQAIFSVDEDIAVGKRLRPAFAAKLDNGINIIGLHLKAGSKETDLRLDQIESLINSPLTDSVENPNTLIIGDFNTYRSSLTRNEVDDVILMDGVFGQTGFTRTAHETSTYLGYGQRIFDRVWSRGLVVKKAEVYGPCRRESVKFPYSKAEYFRRFVSDHCALQVEVDVSSRPAKSVKIQQY